jgi:hypothetical protein
MKAKWLKSGILQLEPETAADVFKLTNFVKSFENGDVKDAPSNKSETLPERTLPVQAQGEQRALQGLPESGVVLTGSPQNPIVENHSGKTVIGFVVKQADQNGRGPVYRQLLTLSVQPAGIPDGGAVYVQGAVPVNSTVGMSLPAQATAVGQGPIVTAILQSVVFADGQFVGTDEYRTFEEFVERTKAITAVGLLATKQGWDHVETLAPQGLPKQPPRGEDHIVYLFRQLAASCLAETRKFKGDAAAMQLAEIYSSLPNLWK